MDMIQLKCKMCGAKLELTPVGHMFECPFCHAEYLLDDSQNTEISTVNSLKYGTSRFSYDGEQYIQPQM